MPVPFYFSIFFCVKRGTRGKPPRPPPLRGRVFGELPPLRDDQVRIGSSRGLRASQGDPRVPTPLPAPPAPTRGGRSNGLLVGEQAEEGFVTGQPSSFAES